MRIRLDPSRREFLGGLAATAFLSGASNVGAFAQESSNPINIARVAIPSSLELSSQDYISALNDGFTPEDSSDRSHGLYTLSGSRLAEEGQPWVQYEWSEPVRIDKVEIYWAVDRSRSAALPGSGWPTLHLPESYGILYWDGSSFVQIGRASCRERV